MTTADNLDRGRESFGRQAWRAAYSELSAADRDDPLELDYLERLATAAYLLGGSDDTDLLARAHQEAVRRGNPARAAYLAFWLGFGFLERGDLAQGSGWLSRAARLLEARANWSVRSMRQHSVPGYGPCGGRVAPVASEDETGRWTVNRDPQTEQFETVVIGGGQAGLAVGYHLARGGQRFVILDAAERVGDSWRRRWYGLRLFTPARYDGLPGTPFPAPAHVHPTKDEVADYLEAYAKTLDLPVRTGIAVDRLLRNETKDPYLILAGDRRFEASQVVVATGAYHRPRVPAFATELDPAIRQIHWSDYRNASQLLEGPVLVVGASNSGAEIAMTAAREHRTVLSGRDIGKMPVRPESRAARLLDPAFWFFINRVLRTDTRMGRKARPFVVDHGGPLERIWPSDLAAAGVERVYARTVGVRDGLPVLEDGRVTDITNVVWCTGFRPDYAWIQPPIVRPDGWPSHVRGMVSGAPGLYIVGLPFLYTAASALLGGVGP